MIGRIRHVVGRLLVGSTLVGVATNDNVVALTFDDGPHPVDTPATLDVLARHDAKATFFVTGEAAARHPDVVALIVAAGHHVGLHGYHHVSAVHRQRTVSTWRQLRRCAATVPSHRRWYRPPYGHETVVVRWVARLLGYRLVGWTAAPNDWSGHTADQVATTLAGQLQPGNVVLLHDTLRSATDAAYFDRQPMIDALDRVLSTTHMRAVTLDDLLAAGRPRRRVTPMKGAPLGEMIEAELS